MAEEQKQKQDSSFSRILDRVLLGFSAILEHEFKHTDDVTEEDWCLVGNRRFFDEIKSIKNDNGKSVWEAIQQIIPYMESQEGSCNLPEGEYAIALLRHRRRFGDNIISEKTRIV